MQLHPDDNEKLQQFKAAVLILLLAFVFRRKMLLRRVSKQELQVSSANHYILCTASKSNPSKLQRGNLTFLMPLHRIVKGFLHLGRCDLIPVLTQYSMSVFKTRQAACRAPEDVSCLLPATILSPCWSICAALTVSQLYRSCPSFPRRGSGSEGELTQLSSVSQCYILSSAMPTSPGAASA